MDTTSTAAASGCGPTPEPTGSIDWLAIASHGHDHPAPAPVTAPRAQVDLLHIIGGSSHLLHAVTRGLQAVGRPAMSVGEQAARTLTNDELRALAPAGSVVVVASPTDAPRHNQLAEGDMVMRVQFAAGHDIAYHTRAIGAVVHAWATQREAA